MKKVLLVGAALAVMGVGAWGCSEKSEDNVEAAQAGISAEDAQTDDYNPDRNAYFGDLHIHTRNSFDAYIFNVRATPDDVYRFALGEGIERAGGYDIKLGGPPLDFVAVTDHGAYLGVIPELDNPESELSKLPIAKGMFSTDLSAIMAAFQNVGFSVRMGKPIAEIYDRDIMDSTWQRTVETADKYYQPGKLTTFAGYEFTAMKQIEVDGQAAFGNLHRNVIFADEAPDRIFTVLDSKNPEDLWDWMDTERKGGRDLLAIPHNSNVSGGAMFAADLYEGGALTEADSRQRMLNEPLVEVAQVKGTSETHPALSPNDEWASFEIWETLIAQDIKGKPQNSYVRQAYGDGLLFAADGKGNPYKFGLIGSSDTHVAGGSFDEQNFWSKIGLIDATPERRGAIPPDGKKSWEGITLDPSVVDYSRWSAAGLAGVWAEENTREAIFAAMRRKETFATSGPRMKVRLFGGFDFDDAMIGANDLVTQAYARGVPMGGDLIGQGGGAPPSFLAWAIRDPNEAPLDRLQIVKIWAEDGKRQEQLYDVACADGTSVDPTTNRCPQTLSKVDMRDCSISAKGGSPELKALWRDPDFDADQNAVYYVRVLQVPTCRWSTWDALRNGTPPNPDLPQTIQERAWTSPIWYVPEA